MVRVEVPAPADTPPLRERLSRAGLRTYEADVRFAMRSLIDRGDPRLARDPRATDASDGRRWRRLRGSGARARRLDATLSVLSFDIETDPQARRLLSIALHGCGVSEVLLLTPRAWSCPDGARRFAHREATLLAAFCDRVRELDPDVLTGWNVIDFDLAVLQRLGGRLGVPLELGREPRHSCACGPWAGPAARGTPRPGPGGARRARPAARRLRPDGGLHPRRGGALGPRRGQDLSGPGRAEEILRLFQDDRESLVEYNLHATRGWCVEILEKLELVELAVERSRLTGMPLDRVASSIAAFDFLYLSELGRRGIVAPSVGPADVERQEPTGGGHVLEPAPGSTRNVLVLDFKSLYPSLIRTFQIDPLNLVRPESERPAPTIRSSRPTAPPSAAPRRSCRSCSTSSCRGARRRSGPGTRSRATRSRS